MARSEWIGKKLSNRYLIEEMLGQGGMSAVYKASDPNLKRVVAIKMIHSHLSNEPDFVQRFEEEASGVAQLRHQGIIQVYDFNKDNDDYYMVMEFVPGETFQQHLKRLNAEGRQLPIQKAVEYMADICDAVDYAHRRGMIHRDIKPANLMLSTHDQAILMDFGIAKIVGGQRHTATGAVVGTAMYMSPEQIRGEHADRRTDIYSLGVTLFEIVSGHPPFQADSAMTLMMMHINDPVPDPKKLNPDVPDDLVAVIRRALAKNPNDRYQTAAEMASALRNISGRLKSGVSAQMPAPAATMLEEIPKPVVSPEATFYEAPRATSDGTVVENATRPSLSTTGSGSKVGGTAIESSVVKPVPVPPAPIPEARPESQKAKLAWPVIVGGFVGLACLIFGGLFLVNRLLGAGANPGATEPPVVVVDDSTETPTATTAAQTTATAAESPTPSLTPTLANTPTATVPAGIPFVRINAITIDDQERYVVDYETFEFTEVLPGTHIHFFFDSVSPENAGSPGSGPWYLYGGPRPFTGYRISERPAAASQMCVLVANSNHSVQANSGNCVDLP
jgi:serine/threonine protein kinase